ncbi:hypothetical protein ACIRP2_38100 [Streptomyces sp. NPDC101194]|uniref:hypothetical protein n=1 Tax=Streptomyces sp. NPDC101194 TaxID=3366127 RepID=UPI003829E5A7
MSGLAAAAMVSSMSAWSNGLEDAFGLPGDTDADHGVAEDLAVLLHVPETGGRGISVVYRYSRDLDAALVLWLIAGP